MWFEDLTKCNYFGEEYSNSLTAIGWLEKGKEFSTGTISRDIYFKLGEFRKKPWHFSMFMGFHQCNLCQFQFEFSGEKGISNIFILGNGRIYVSPELITHYMNTHFYQPPREFLEAVYLCPSQDSVEYLKKMLENGGRDYVKLMKQK